MGGSDASRRLATWLVRARRVIDARAAARHPLPPERSAEAEALRRFRSFVTSALLRGDDVLPSLEGLRVHERRLAPVLRAWVEAAGEVAGAESARVRTDLEPLLDRFRAALRTTAPARRASGAPRAQRRAVTAAIDRVADAFLAVDPASGTILDANPAAGALLGTTRDALLGADALRFVPEVEHERWWTQLDALCEGAETRQYHGALKDARGESVHVEASLTRYATRRRTLALVMARPRTPATP